MEGVVLCRGEAVEDARGEGFPEEVLFELHPKTYGDLAGQREQRGRACSGGAGWGDGGDGSACPGATLGGGGLGRRFRQFGHPRPPRSPGVGLPSGTEAG